MLRLLAAIYLSVACGAPAGALQLSADGTRIRIEGKIRPGDEFEFFRFMAAPERNSITQVWLSSDGGYLEAAIEIGRYIRAHDLTTIVDADVSRCESACTILFGAGSRRRYLNANSLVSKLQPFGGKGLGFHQAYTADSNQPAGFSGEGTSIFIGAYYEFGIKAAVDLVDKAPPNLIYRLSGADALAMGIATALK